MKATLRLCSDDSCMILLEGGVITFGSFSEMAAWSRQHPEYVLNAEEVQTQLS